MSSSITPELAAGLRSVLVYGADLQAFDVLATLIGTGVDAGDSAVCRLESCLSMLGIRDEGATSTGVPNSTDW